MNTELIISLIIGLSAFFAYINQRFIKMPFVIGLFFLSTIISIGILFTKFFSHEYFVKLKFILDNIDISKYVLEYMLGYLLFAGAFHTDWKDIRDNLKPIIIFSVFGVLVSTFLIGEILYETLKLFNIQLSLIYCMLFGALISPTDPIAVLGILKKANVSKKIEGTIVGESLFNDGVGVVVFLVILDLINNGNTEFNFLRFGTFFIQESFGGIGFGLLSGYILHKALSTIDHYETEVLLTLAFVMIGYKLSNSLHISGALAMVVMGLYIGNYKQNKSMSDTTMEYVNKFWELIDVILNSVLFVIISFVLVVVDFKQEYIIIAIISIFIVLLSRALVIYLSKLLFHKIINYDNQETKLIIWGGLRGGLSLALVLSLPNTEQQHILLILTYFCVVFSILIQGLTIGQIAKITK
ncbi:MAG: sodium:proton antiporter [Candidatus Sericytochromatia bacterium]